MFPAHLQQAVYSNLLEIWVLNSNFCFKNRQSNLAHKAKDLNNQVLTFKRRKLQISTSRKVLCHFFNIQRVKVVLWTKFLSQSTEVKNVNKTKAKQTKTYPKSTIFQRAFQTQKWILFSCESILIWLKRKEIKRSNIVNQNFNKYHIRKSIIMLAH